MFRGAVSVDPAGGGGFPYRLLALRVAALAAFPVIRVGF
jgi:hypothetical protein